MQLIDNSTAVASMPTPKATGNPGYFSDTNGTIVSADWLNGIQGEISAVITAAGITRSKTDNTQLLQALDNRYSRPDLTGYLTIASAALTYETPLHAASTYLSITNAASTYLARTDASSIYLSITSAASTYLSLNSAANIYLTINNAASTYATNTNLNTNFPTFSYITANYFSSTYIRTNYATSASIAATYQPILGYQAANVGGDTFIGGLQLNSNFVVGTGSSASPIADQHNGVGWNTTTWQHYGIGSHFQIGMGNGNGAGDFVEFFWNTGFRANTLVGSIALTGGGAGIGLNTTSDYRAKQVVGLTKNALTRIENVKVHRLYYLIDQNKIEQDAFLAHELAKHIPEVVSGEKDAIDENGNPIFQMVDYSKLVPTLWAAIQELSAEIKLLKKERHGRKIAIK